MIPDSLITINLSEKSSYNQTYYPREMDGLLRVNPGGENSVSMKLTSPDGACIIGTASGCMVSAPTSRPGSLYQNVLLGNESLLVGYSGAGQRVQQFTVLPTDANATIMPGPWHIDIVKNNQVSRFYYQVTYMP